MSRPDAQNAHTAQARAAGRSTTRSTTGADCPPSGHPPSQPFRRSVPFRLRSARACLPYLWRDGRQSGRETRTGSRFRALSDEQWERIEPLLPSNAGRRGHPFGDDRKVAKGIVYRYRTGIPWRDLPRDVFGPWQAVWKRHRRYAGDGTWDRAGCWHWPMRMLPGKLAGGSAWMPRSPAPTSMRRTRPARNRTQGAVPDYKNLPLADCEPAGHGIGRSPGGLSTKIHAGAGGHGRPLHHLEPHIGEPATNTSFPRT